LNRELNISVLIDQAGAQCKRPAALGLHALSTIQNEIQNHLLHLRRIALYWRQGFLQIKDDLGAGQIEFMLSEVCGGANQLVEVSGGALGFGAAGESQEIGDDASDARGLGRDQAEILAKFSLATRRISATSHEAFEQHGEIEHTGDGIINFVRDACGQLSERGETVGLDQFPLGALELLGAFLDFDFERLLHIVEVVHRNFQALAHAVEGIDQLIEFLAALGNLDVLIEIHLANRLCRFYELPNWSSDEAARKQNHESGANADLE